MTSHTAADRRIRVAHFSDLHYSPKNLVESDRCFGFAVREAVARGADVGVISGDATDHALDVHTPAVESLAQRVLELANHCPVLMLQGTFSHEPPGTLAIFPLLAGKHAIHVVTRICQVGLLNTGKWVESDGWRFESLPDGVVALFTCIPAVNKGMVAATVGAGDAGDAMGKALGDLLAGFAGINQAARDAMVPTVGVSHGTVSGCITEHGVPMAGFDHEFTTTGLFAAQAQAFMLGHIHKHQSWEEGSQVIAYAGSIGRFHHGEVDAKGFVMWDVAATYTRLALIETPARRTVDLVFAGKPDLASIQEAASGLQLEGAYVRVRWSVPEEDRSEIDREAIKRALSGAAQVQMEGRVVPVMRSRAEGISKAPSLAEKVRFWAAATTCQAEPLVERLGLLSHQDPEAIVAAILLQSEGPGTESPAEAQRSLGEAEIASAKEQESDQDWAMPSAGLTAVEADAPLPELLPAASMHGVRMRPKPMARTDELLASIGGDDWFS